MSKLSARITTRLVALTLPLVCATFCVADDPSLVIDNGGHTSAIRGLAFTSDGRRLISAGEDKVIRIWSVQTGRVEQTLRGEIARGQDGKIMAIALSSDDRTLASAGYLTGQGRADVGAIRLHSLPSGEITDLLTGSGNVTLCLAFSPRDELLASGSADFSARIWNVASRRLIKTIPDKTRIHTLAFSKNGAWLAWGTLDGRVHLWSVTQNRMYQEFAPASAPVVSVAFSPDSRYLVSADSAATVRVWETASKSLAASFPGGDAGASDPANLSFTPDGRSLLVTSQRDALSLARILNFPSGTRRVDFTQHTRAVRATAISEDGRIAATAGGDRNEIILWNTSDGTQRRVLSGAGSTVWSAAFSSDGRSVAFGQSRGSTPVANNRGPLEHVIQLSAQEPAGGAERYHIATAPVSSRFNPYPSIQRLGPVQISTDRTGAVLRVDRGNGRSTEIALNPATGYRHLSYTLTTDGRFVISGGLSGILAAYSADDGHKIRDFVGHTGHIWGIGLSPDGTTMVTGSEDQTVRVWDLKSGKSLFCFFPGDDGEWVAWTPEGYYTSSLNGDKYVGWQVNQGNKSLARYYTVAQFQKTFYRPDVIAQHIQSRDIGVALSVANRIQGEPRPEQQIAKPADVVAAVPPEVYVAYPSEQETVHSPAFALKGVVISTSIPIQAVRVLLDGVLMREYKPGAKRQELDVSVRLTKGKHLLAIEASNGISSAQPLVREITSDFGAAAEAPNLYFLAIGISRYSDDAISLRYAHRDAEELERLVRKQENGPVFKTVQTRLLPNEKATRRGIFEALNWLAKSGNPTDTRILFLAGHGGLAFGDTKNYFFCSYDCKAIDNAADGVNWNDLLAALRASGGRSILMVDTCHASAVSGERGLLPLSSVDFTEVLKQSKERMSGITYFTASMGTEASIEKPEWQHGAFTKALIEAISGAAKRDGVIESNELGEFLRKRVEVLTDKKQHTNFFSEPRDTPSFPLFSVVR
jgi:WD40 repeat protein